MASSSSSSSSSHSPLKAICISTILVATTLFFLLFPPHSPSKPLSRRLLLQSDHPPPPPPPHRCSAVLDLPTDRRCSFSRAHCLGDSQGLINYAALHFCSLSGNPRRSLPALVLLLLLHFSLLVRAASSHFSPAVSTLSFRLRLTPSTAAVTLLALGNGAPDVFASVAAVRGGHARTGLGAILSAGTFVTAVVVGSVAILAAPFPLDPAPFIRDVFSYLLAVSALFYVYLSAEIYLWQAVGFIGFYVFFVGLVFWMDLVAGRRGGGAKEEETGRRGGGAKEEEEVHMGLMGENILKKASGMPDCEALESSGQKEGDKSGNTFCGILRKVIRVWEAPIVTILKLTIPSTTPTKWSRFYIAANIGLCPLILLYSFNSFIAWDSQIVFLLPWTHFPFWSVVVFICLSLATVHFFLEKEPPETEQIATTIIAFVMSVFWISTMAGEILNCLAAIGTIMQLPPAILGLTVLAWGNSLGDLVADVAVAKSGQPALAVAGCFVGPMFNMLIGLGTALVIETASVYPGAYELRFHISIVVAFVFLLVSLMGSLLVVTWFRFRVPRFWGFCLAGLYLLFTAVSLVIARFSG